MDSKINALEEKFRNREIRNFYQEAKKPRGGYYNRSAFYKSKTN